MIYFVSHWVWSLCPKTSSVRQIKKQILNHCQRKIGASPVTQTIKNLPAMQETQVRSLGQEDPLEKGMTTHSSVLALEIPWTEKPGGLRSIGWRSVGHNGSDWAYGHVLHYLNTFPKLIIFNVKEVVEMMKLESYSQAPLIPFYKVMKSSQMR